MDSTVLFLHGALVRTSRLILEGLAAFAAERGWQVLNICPPKSAGPGYLRRIAAHWNAIGIVEDCGAEKTMPIPGSPLGIPFVCIDLDPSKRKALRPSRRSARPRPVGFVEADTGALVQMAVQELMRQDFMSYAYVSAHKKRYWSDLRRAVFQRMIEEAGGDFYSFDGLSVQTGDAPTIRKLGEWLNTLPKPCGILAANDRTAALVLSAARRHGMDVPGMVGVIGIDNDAMLCENMHPSLSSVEVDFRRGGFLAGQLLDGLLTGEEAGGTSLRYGAKRFVQRLSTRRLKQQMPSVRTALDFIRRHAVEGISAADVLPLLGGSRRSAEKRFRAAVGKSILEEIADVRFERLFPLLEQRHLPLNTLAGRTGFASENLLQRQFKARTGMTLSAYRRQLGP